MPDEIIYDPVTGGDIGAIQVAPGGGGPPIGSDTIGNDIIGGSIIINSDTIGAAETFGEVGSSPVTDGVPGDLGDLYASTNRKLLLVEALRRNSTFNGIVPSNHRYRGHREAPKFNLTMQKLVTICARLFLTLRTANLLLEGSELDDMYPTDTEIRKIYHISAQIRFKEWQLLKDDNKKWFV
jgi:hypothetical protein